ncbi:MAG TPA: ribonuclease P protein component [Candidatus Saccharimonadales bacterium]|nr:ribonuclease P protein component [Candidatus Saccharimonadales bacterium]
MLAKENRLTKKIDFENLRQNGKFLTTPYFSFSFIKRETGTPSRFGFIVSKKISKSAVVRNKVKRTLREIVRKNISTVKGSWDAVFLVKPRILNEESLKIEREALKCLETL